jgi:transposase
MDGQKGNVRTTYPRQFKLQVAEEVISGKKGPSEAARDYNIDRGMVYNWTKRFGAAILDRKANEVLPLLSMKKSIAPQQKPDLEKQVKALEEENLKLRKKLLESTLQAEALNTLIDLAEENYGLSLRKNSGAKQSIG